MAAPPEAYHNNGNAVISLHKVAVSKADCYPAINIYGSADLKALFYLDGFLIFPQKQTDGTIIESFLGYVLEGGANIGMHNGARWSKNRLPVKVNGVDKNAVVLNDAGLNTKGNLGAISILSQEVGNIKPQIPFKSAYWNDTTEYGFYYRVNSGSWIKAVAGYYIAQNTTLTAYVIIDIDSIAAGDQVDIQAYITNEEGTHNPGLLTWFYAKPRKLTLKYNATYASSAFNGTATRDIYIGNAVLRVGSLVYGTEELSTQAAAGYYIEAGWWYEVRFDPVLDKTKVVAQGVCAPSGWPSNDPLYDDGSYTSEQAFYSATQANVCFSDQLVTIYRRNYNGLYYKNTAFTALADDGYYRYNTGRWNLISGGTKFTSGSGNTGLCGA